MSTKLQQMHEELCNKDGIVYCDNGLYCAVNFDFAKNYIGNRYVVGANFDSDFIAPQELVEANKRVNSVKTMLRKYADEKGSDTPFFYDKNIPVLITKIENDYIIVDGQNRIAACRDLNIPYYFRLLDDINTEEELLSYIKRLNYTRTYWTKSQQIGSDARLGNPYAKVIIDLEREYKIPVSAILYFTVGKASHKLSLNYTTTQFDIERAKEIAELIVEVANHCTETEKESLTLRKDNRFTNFITYVYENNKVNVLKRRMLVHTVKKIKGASSIWDYAIRFHMMSNLK